MARQQTGARWLALAVVVALAACDSITDTSEQVKSADLVGTWHGDCGAELVLSEGGTLQARDFDDLERHKISGPGKWQIAKGTSDGPAFHLAVTLDDSPSIESIDFAVKSKKLTLVQTFGDPDNNDTCRFSQV
jgi:hypothetical protein